MTTAHQAAGHRNHLPGAAHRPLPDGRARGGPAKGTPAPALALPLTVLHRTPGRVRLSTRALSPADAEALTDRVRRHPGVCSARHSPRAGSLTVHHDPRQGVAGILGSLPPTSRPLPVEPHPSPEHPAWRELAMPVLSLAAGLLGVAPLSSVVIGLCSAPIGRRALRSMARRRVNIDVLDATAVSLLLGTGDTMAAGVSVALIETGERIRRRASGRARRVLRGWMGADAADVRVMRAGSEPRVPLADLLRGERAVVYAGDTVPVDGVVVTGTGSVDNRTWTGEPYPVTVSPGTAVLAGSTVQDGRLVLEVRALGEDTRAARLAAALEDAIAADTRVSDMARRMADRFVVPLLLLGGGTLLATADVARLVSILIVDFGTGIRVAVPTSVLTTMIAGARQGILFRNGNAIEQLAGVDTVVFDKTGTLTTGRPAVTRVVTRDGWSPTGLLRLAAAAEGHIPHPVAGAVRRHARGLGLELPQPDDIRYIRGGGVLASIEGRQVLVGSPRLLQLEGIEVPAVDIGDSSVAVVAVDGAVAGRVVLRDGVRENAREMITALRSSGIGHIVLATGDRPAAARAVVGQLGLDNFSARMLPEDKAALVSRLRRQGRKVALVGDGMNDAAALAEAHVGIAVSSGADLTRETADVVLGGDDLLLLPAALGLSRRSMALVRENLGLVAVPNSIALAAALAGALPPLGATAANNGSTLLAALNALRPLRWHRASTRTLPS